MQLLQIEIFNSPALINMTDHEDIARLCPLLSLQVSLQVISDEICHVKVSTTTITIIFPGQSRLILQVNLHVVMKRPRAACGFNP